MWRTFQSYPAGIRRSGQVPSNTFVKHPFGSTFDGKKVLNLGCGTTVFRSPNVVNLDAYPGDGINAVVDLAKGKLPFADGEFDLIIANHVMEHIPNWFETMKEMARVTKLGGIIEIWTPPISSDAAFSYRDHINYIGPASFCGCRSIGRAGVNVSATEEFKTLAHFRDLDLINYRQRTIINWFTTIAPEWLLALMASHLRNIVTEEGFFFRKVAPK